ncbi:hypothetical protein ACLESD_11945 [Pyxidicoccus sp. 3LFB2]
MSRKKFRAAFTRLLLVAPTLPLLACGEPLFFISVSSRTLPDGGVFPRPGASCEEICREGLQGCYNGIECHPRQPGPNGGVVADCSSWCDGRRPEGLAKPGRVKPDSELGALFALKAHLEAASVPAFERLARELEAHGAPSPLVRRALRSAQEEVRHAQAMEALALRHGASMPEVVVEPFRPRSLEAMALENAREGCVRESLGALMAGWQARTAADAEVREVMTAIAQEELGHSELAWAIDSWAARRLGVAGSARLHEAKEEALRQLERDVEASHHSEELVVRAGLPSREAARKLLDGLAEVVRRPALA